MKDNKNPQISQFNKTTPTICDSCFCSSAKQNKTEEWSIIHSFKGNWLIYCHHVRLLPLISLNDSKLRYPSGQITQHIYDIIGKLQVSLSSENTAVFFLNTNPSKGYLCICTKNIAKQFITTIWRMRTSILCFPLGKNMQSIWI